MATAAEGNKAKTARRVIEVLEFFDEQNRQATVMDIVRRYNRPQSSTSELLASLVELGLLYKEPGQRLYTLTPRAAILGSISQPRLLRDGSLSTLIDRLVAQTGLGVALFGMVGLNAQIFRWTAGSKHPPRDAGDLRNGVQTALCDSAAGQLLLSTIRAERRAGVIRRLNAEAAEDRKFSYPDMSRTVQELGRQGFAIGPACPGGPAEMAAIFVPNEPGERPMVLSFIYEPNAEIDPEALIALLQKAVQRCIVPSIGDGAEPVAISSAA
jgi:DNA-binding IclR family transcriptional regulator